MAKETDQLNLTVVALVALVAIVGLVALVMNAAGAARVPALATGSELAAAEENLVGDSRYSEAKAIYNQCMASHGYDPSFSDGCFAVAMQLTADVS